MRAPIGAALVLAVSVAALSATGPARAVEEDLIGWWIYADSARSTLTTRFFGPEGLTPAAAAAVQAARGCGLALRAERLSKFRETPIGDEPLVFGPWVTRAKVTAALACVRRYVPAAFVTQSQPPK